MRFLEVGWPRQLPRTPSTDSCATPFPASSNRSRPAPSLRITDSPVLHQFFGIPFLTAEIDDEIVQDTLVGFIGGCRCACGCGGVDGPDVEYVEGVVTLDSKPIEGVTVGFSPTKADSGTPATGMTDANGVFKLTATGGGAAEKGTSVGEYNVSFFKIPIAAANQSFEEEHAAAEKEAEKGEQPAINPKDPKRAPSRL